jgi:hypothetical protein
MGYLVVAAVLEIAVVIAVWRLADESPPAAAEPPSSGTTVEPDDESDDGSVDEQPADVELTGE